MSAVLLALLFYKNMMKADRETILCGVILGIFLCLSYQSQTYGLKYTTASKNAFITTLYVIIVLFLNGSSAKRDRLDGISLPRFLRSSVLRFVTAGDWITMEIF